MKESDTEGVANHGDPESCEFGREAGGEALTGACAGTVLSREIGVTSGCRRCPGKRKATREVA